MPAVTLPELFAAQVARAPEATAVVSEDVRLDYAELDARANRLAHLLIEHGAGPEQTVAVALPRSPEQVVTLLAVIKAGAAYLPLDPTYPADRIAFMLADARPTVVVTDRRHIAFLPDTPATPVLPLDEAARDGRLDRSPAHPPADADRLLPLSPAHPAYVIYTSGSTGTPKGVVMPGVTLVNLFTWHAAHLPCGSGIRTAQLSALGFDVSLHEILSTLTLGKCLVIPAEETRRDPHALVRWLERHRVHQVFLPNLMLASIATVVGDDTTRLPDLRHVLQSGEALTLGGAVGGFLRGRPHLRVLNQYGSAEMQDVVGHELRGAAPDLPAIAPIGRPLWNMRVHVLDENLRPVPEGVTGELYVAGAGLARGYLNAPGLTAERFLPDPFGAPGERMYRTGDLARWNTYGLLEHLGRVDTQVKIRGYRVEVGEIEAVLLRRPDVAHAAVAARQGPGRRGRLVAYVVPAGGAGLDPAEIRRHLARVLPEYMVPSVVVPLDRLPLTPSGKVDRGALPAPSRPAPDGEGPTTTEEKILCECFAQVLDLPAVAVDDGFFELGGDSVLAVRLVGEAHRRGLRLSVGDIFEHRTVRAVAAAMTGTGATGVPAGAGPLLVLDERQLELLQAAAPDVTSVLPLSPLQRGLLFHAMRDETGTHTFPDAYVERLELRLRGTLDSRALRVAAKRLLRRHPALRAGFQADGLRRPVQFIPASTVLPWRERTLDEGDEEGFARLVREETEEFDRGLVMNRPPLLRFLLVHLGRADHRLVLIHHHILFDGWSMGVLVRDLLALYRSPDPPALPPVPPPSAHPRWLAAQDHQAAAAAWSRALDGMSEPTRLGADAAFSSPPRHRRVVLTRQQSVRLEQVAREHGLTLSTVVQGAWGLLLGEYTGHDDVVFGTTVAGRPPEITGVENAVGLLANTVPVRVRFGRDEAAPVALRRLQAEQARLLPHQFLALGDIQRHAGWRTSFDTLVVVENPALRLDASAVPPDGLAVAGVEASDHTHYALCLMVLPGVRLELCFGHRPELLDARRTEVLAEGLRRFLVGFAADPRQQVGALLARGAMQHA